MAFKAGDIVFELKGDIKGLNDAMARASANVRKTSATSVELSVRP